MRLEPNATAGQYISGMPRMGGYWVNALGARPDVVHQAVENITD
jgi:hypothetical protein